MQELNLIRFAREREYPQRKRTSPCHLGRQVVRDAVTVRCAEYNSNNTWNFNGNNRSLNNNNRYNGVFRSRPVVDIPFRRNQDITNYIFSLQELFELDKQIFNKKRAAFEFRFNYIQNMISLWHDLNQGNYSLGNTYRIIVDTPKIREIVYCEYRDKLVQTWFVNQINPYLETLWLHKDSYSCRKNKGVIAAVDKLQGYLVEAVKNNPKENIYLASFDIKNFFMSIDIKLSIKLIKEFLENHYYPSTMERKRFVMNLVDILYGTPYQDNYVDLSNNKLKKIIPIEKTLVYNQPKRGVPIGNWPSQILGNFLTTFILNEITKLGYKFVHYTDDTAVIVTDKNKWLKDLKYIKELYKEKLNLIIHPHKIYSQHYSKGINFLGRKVKVNRKLPSDRTFNSVHKVVRFYTEILPETNYTWKNLINFQNTLNSYLGLLRSMNTFNIRKKLLNKINNSPIGEYYTIDLLHFEKIVLHKCCRLESKYKRHYIYNKRIIRLMKELYKIKNYINKVNSNQYKYGKCKIR